MRSFSLRLPVLVMACCFFMQVGYSESSDVPQVEMQLDRWEVLVGEPMQVTLDIRWNDPDEMIPFHLADRLGAFSITQMQESEKTKGSASDWQKTITFTLTAFDLGELEIPELEIAYRDAQNNLAMIKTITHPIIVNSYLEQIETEETPAELRPLRPPHQMPISPFRMLIYVALAVLFSLVLFLLFRKFSGSTDDESTVLLEPALPAAEEALGALANLEQEKAAERMPVKEFYLKLSYILRRYLGRRYRFAALDMTSSELLDTILDIGWQKKLYDLLELDVNESDAVKFAKVVPPYDSRTQALQRIRKMISWSRPADEQNMDSQDEAETSITSTDEERGVV